MKLKKIICFIFGHKTYYWESDLAKTCQCKRCGKYIWQTFKYVGALGIAAQNSREKFISEMFRS